MVMTVFNGSYDSASISISVDPGVILTAANTVEALGDGIADSVSRINDTLAALKLSWQSKSSTESTSFTDRWTTVMNEVFGSEADPAAGTLNRFMSAVQAASGNYALCEGGVSTMFSQIATSLNGTGSGTAPPTDVTLPPILETF
jgi:uncharacterized protein YukE